MPGPDNHSNAGAGETNTTKAERLLGWRTRPAKSTILDTANSLIEKELV